MKPSSKSLTQNRVSILSCLDRAAFLTVALGLAGCSAGVNNAPSTAAVLTGETPSVTSFTDTIGVNIHMHNNFGNDAYGNVPVVEFSLAYAGIRHARDVMSYAADVGTLQAINAATGTTYDIFIGGDLAQSYTYISSNAKIVEAVEGFNEPENFPQSFGGATGIPAAVLAQQQLWSDIKSSPSTQNITVNSMALANSQNASTVGNIAAYTNQISSHIYPIFYGVSGESTFNTIQKVLSASTLMAPGDPAVITEGGWWTYPAINGTTEAAQAKLTLSYLLDAFAQGVTRTYLYELLDEHQPIASASTATITPVGGAFDPIVLPAGLPNLAVGSMISVTHDNSDYIWGTVSSYNSSTGATSIAVTKTAGSGTYSSWTIINKEDSFGFFEWDGTPKQSAVMLHNLAGILADPSGSSARLPGAEAYTLTGMPSTGHSFLLKRSDGSYFVALWRDDAIWDNNGNELAVTPVAVTVTPWIAPAAMSVYNPTVGTSPTSTVQASSVQVSLGDTPLFILIH